MTTQLALVEVRLLRRSPALWASALAVVALLAWQERREPMMPNVAADTLVAATGLLVVGVTLMVVANLATLRDQRGDMPETLAAMPGRATVRTGAVAVAMTCAGIVVATLIVGAYVLMRTTTGPVAGVFDVTEMLAAVMGVAALAALGVLLARWLPTLIAAPVVLVVLLVFIAERSLTLWLLPLTETFAGDALGAPSSLRLPYLSAVAVLAGALALLRHQPIALRVAGIAVALAVLAPLALGVSRAIASGAAAEVGRDCTERNGVTYCHLPGFAAWVPLWVRAVEPVRNALPSDIRDRFPTIRQYRRVPQYGAQVSVDAYVDEFWGREELQVESEIFLAGRVSADLTGFDAAGATCDGRGQARTVVALWLAGHAAAVPGPNERDAFGATHLGPVVYGEREHRYASALLNEPAARRLIGRHWDTLIDPATTIEQAAPLLGLSPPPPATGRSVAQPCR